MGVLSISVIAFAYLVMAFIFGFLFFESFKKERKFLSKSIMIGLFWPLACMWFIMKGY